VTTGLPTTICVPVEGVQFSGHIKRIMEKYESIQLFHPFLLSLPKFKEIVFFTRETSKCKA
jgi:hypothetical protein